MGKNNLDSAPHTFITNLWAEKVLELSLIKPQSPSECEKHTIPADFHCWSRRYWESWRTKAMFWSKPRKTDLRGKVGHNEGRGTGSYRSHFLKISLWIPILHILFNCSLVWLLEFFAPILIWFMSQRSHQICFSSEWLGPAPRTWGSLYSSSSSTSSGFFHQSLLSARLKRFVSTLLTLQTNCSRRTMHENVHYLSCCRLAQLKRLFAQYLRPSWRDWGCPQA